MKQWAHTIAVSTVVAANIASAEVNTEVVTLDQVIERALLNDPRISEQKKLVDVARTLLQEAQGSDDLIFGLDAFIGLTSKVEGGFFENNNSSNDPRSDRYEWNGLTTWTNLQLTIIKPLYTFGKIENYSDAAKSNIRVKEEDVRKQRADTIMDANRAYYGYLAARDTRYLFKDVIVRLNGAIKLVKRRLADSESEDDIRQSDLYALQAGKALISKYLAQAAAIEKIAMAGLKVLTGGSLDDMLEVSDKRVTPVPLPDVALDLLTQTALAKRPEMIQLEAGLQARRSLIAARQAEKMPNVYAGIAALASYAPNRTRLDNPFIYDPFNDYGATPLLGIKWNWESGVHAARVARAEAELAALVEKSTFAQRGIPFEVAEQYYQVQGGYEAVQNLAQGSRAARRWMVSSYADFEAGIGDAEDSLTAFQGYVLVHSDYLSAVNDYNMNVARLRYVVGEYQ